MKRSLLHKFAVAGATATLAFGGVACEAEQPADPGLEGEDPLEDDTGGDTGDDLGGEEGGEEGGDLGGEEDGA